MAVKILALRADAHRVDAEADLLERLLGVQVLPLPVVAVKFLLAEAVKILHDRKIRRTLFAVVRGIRNAEARIELGEQNLNRVELRVREILIGAEEVFQKRNVLREPRHPPKCVRHRAILVANALIHSNA